MPKSDRFPAEVVEMLRSAKILGVRAGSSHKFTGVWPVVVDGRLFARSWSDKPTGWFQAFRAERTGAIQFAHVELDVRARIVRGDRLRDAVTRAFAEKYPTKGSRKWVEGFAEPARAANTIEFIPRAAAGVRRLVTR